MEDECGGVGDIYGKAFMWVINGVTVDAVFDTGEFIEFEDGEEGWSQFLLMGLILAGAL